MLAQRGGDSVYTLFVEVDEPLDSFKEYCQWTLLLYSFKNRFGRNPLEELNELLDRPGEK